MSVVLVLDTNALISAALSPGGHSAQLIELARRGRISLIMSDHLCDELESRLEREKFRRWLSLEDVRDFVDAVSVVADWVDDRPNNEIPLVCDDPDDNYLVALVQDSQATMLVSGDKAVLRIRYPRVDVRKPADAMKALDFIHEWGDGYLAVSDDHAEAQIEAEGNAGILTVCQLLAVVVQDARAHDMLPFVVVPEVVEAFREALPWLREQFGRRGFASFPHYVSTDLAYVRLPPDPGVTVRVIVDDMALPEDLIFATMQRCPDLVDLPGMHFDHWRVFWVGGIIDAELIPPRPASET